MASVAKRRATSLVTVPTPDMGARCATPVCSLQIMILSTYIHHFISLTLILCLAVLPMNCHAYALRNSIGEQADIEIDIDGSGPLHAFPVTCYLSSNYHSWTLIEISHISTNS